MASEDQIRANRENAKLSQGAKTPETRQKCSMNATKHGLTARTIVLPHEQVSEYNQCVAIVFNQYKPLTDMEKLIIQEVADTTWKLQRVSVFETGLYAKGYIEFSHLYGPDIVAPEHRDQLICAETQHQYSKTFANLSLQQGKAQSHLNSKLAQFEKLRSEREVIHQYKANRAMQSILGDPDDNRPCHPTVGVDFSLDYLAYRIEFMQVMGPKGAEKIAIFDRYWGDPKAKTAA